MDVGRKYLQNVATLTDSLSALRRLEPDRFSYYDSVTHKMKEVLKKQKSNDISVTFVRVKAQAGFLGNEAADRRTKNCLRDQNALFINTLSVADLSNITKSIAKEKMETELVKNMSLESNSQCFDTTRIRLKFGHLFKLL